MRSLFVGTLLAAVLAGSGANANPTLLFELSSGQVIKHEEAFQRWYPASLTKLMTAYVTFRALQSGELELNSPITVSKAAAAEQPAKMGFAPGSVMTLDNALKMMLVRSANDIAAAIGENVGGSTVAFVSRMNGEAARLGMKDTHFSNANGLPAVDQYTTARDLALLVMALRLEFPQYAHYFAIEGLEIGKKRLSSFNLLAGRYPGADGMKTGFICSSGFNMIGTATRNGRTLVAIVLGESSAEKRAEAAAALLDEGFADPKARPVTVTDLAPYGTGTDVVRDVRDEICPKPVAGKAAEEPSEQASAKAKSPFLMPIENRKLVKVGLGNAEGKTPDGLAAAMAAGLGPNFGGVPIPTPRPDYTASTVPESAAETAAAGEVGG